MTPTIRKSICQYDFGRVNIHNILNDLILINGTSDSEKFVGSCLNFAVIYLVEKLTKQGFGDAEHTSHLLTKDLD